MHTTEAHCSSVSFKYYLCSMKIFKLGQNLYSVVNLDPIVGIQETQHLLVASRGFIEVKQSQFL